MNENEYKKIMNRRDDDSFDGIGKLKTEKPLKGWEKMS